MSTELVQVEEVQPEKFGIEQKQATELMGDLPLIKQERESLKVEFQQVIKLDIEQPETAQIAGDLRKRILKNRTQGIERWHKDAKQFFLRGGQFVDEIKRMEIRVNEAMEQALAQIEKHQEIKEQQRREALRQERLTQLQAYDGTEIAGLIDFTQEQFDSYLLGVKAQYEAKQKAEAERIEAERIENLHNERKLRLSKYEDFIPNIDEVNLGKLTEDEFIAIGMKAKADKDAYDVEQARIKAENERLQKEKEEAERKQREAIEKAERERKEAEAKAKAEADRLKAEADARLKAEQEARAKAEAQAQAEANRLKAEVDAKLQAEQAEKQKAIDEANRLKEAEQNRIQDEQARKDAEIAEQKRIAKQGESKRIQAWIESFELPELPAGNYNAESKAQIDAIIAKFNGFKSWANQQ